jgi:PhnB protein
MAQTNTHLHFTKTCEEAFNFYKSAFGTEFIGEITRMGDVPTMEGQTPLSDADKQLVMYVQLPILGGHVLVGNDAPEWMGPLVQGNNVDIGLDPDTRADADRLFAALSEGGKVEYPMGEMFGGGYFGAFVDKFGVQWLIGCTSTR